MRRYKYRFRLENIFRKFLKFEKNMKESLPMCMMFRLYYKKQKVLAEKISFKVFFKTTLNHKQFEKRDRIKKIEYISNSRNKIRKYRIAPRSKLRKIKTDVRNFESTHELCPHVQNPCKSDTIAKPIEINSMQLVKNNSIEKLFGAVVSPEANKSCRPRSEITTEVVGMAQFCALG